MHEAIEQSMGYIKDIWKYRWPVLALAWIVATAGWFWVYNMPDKYEASASVYIDTDSILRPLLKGLTIETDIEQKLELMTKTILSRPNIEKIIRMTDMDISVTTESGKERMISKLTNDIKFKKMGKRRELNTYKIRYSSTNRDLSKKVVEALLTILFEGSIGGKREDTDVAKVFINEQIKDYEDRLVAAEDRLTRFKQINEGVLPGQGGGYYVNLQKLKESQIVAVQERREATYRYKVIDSQLKEIVSTGSLASSIDLADNSPLSKRIHALQSNLDEMLLKFTEQHPNIQQLRRNIVALKSRLKKEKAEWSIKGKLSVNSSPLYQELKITLANEKANVAALNSRVNGYTSRINDLQKQIETLPRIEAELKRLDRDYNINKGNHTALVARRESARLASRAEKAGDVIKFRIIDPPWVPYAASKPNRLMLNSLVLLVSLGAGIGLSFVVGQLRPVIHGRKSLQDLTGLPVWGGISLVLTNELLIKEKRKTWLFIFIFILLIFMYAGSMAVELNKRGIV